MVEVKYNSLFSRSGFGVSNHRDEASRTSLIGRCVWRSHSDWSVLVGEAAPVYAGERRPAAVQMEFGAYK